MITAVRSIVENILSSGVVGASNTPYARKIRFFNSTVLVSSLLLVVLSIIHFSDNFSYYGFLDISLVLLLGIIFLYQRESKDISISSTLLFVILIILYQYLLITGIFGSIGFLIIFLFPLVASFLKNDDEAFYWSMYLIISLALSIVLNQLGFIQFSYAYSTVLAMLIIYFVYSILVYILVHTNKISENILIQRSNDLYKMNLELSNQVKERQKAEIELKQENARDEAIFSNIGDGMIVVDQDFIIVMGNKSAGEMLGYKSQDLIGKVFTSFIHLVNEEKKEIDKDTNPIVISLREKKKISSSDFLFKRSDGSAFSASITASPIVIYNKPVGGIIIFRDVSREKDVDRMKTEFISLASHQLRTPLTAMKWFLEMLLNGDAGELNTEQKKYIEQINESNEREIALVNSLLNISRIESGRIIIDPQPTRLEELAQSVIDELKPKFSEKNLSVALDTDDNLPEISIDKKLIREVLMNLISNASKYTPHDGSITVAIKEIETKIQISVTDTGYGIPEKEKGRVFEKFFRAANVVKYETEGTGLGLYLVKSIITESGGRIWFESKEGKGTTFTFTLPKEGSKPKKGEVSLA